MASRKVVKKSPAKKSPAKKSSRSRKSDREGDGFYDKMVLGTDGGNLVAWSVPRPINARGAGGKTLRSPEALRAQAEGRWAQYKNRMGPGRSWDLDAENYQRNTTDESLRRRGNEGKLASKQKTKGKSGPTKKR